MIDWTRGTDFVGAAVSATRRVAPTSPGSTHERRALAAMHRIFRYPAKFYGPLARGLLEDYTTRGSRVLDPFCGSGTLTLEGQITGRCVDGADVDPLAVFVAQIKSRPYEVDQLRAKFKVISESLDVYRRTNDEYEYLQFHDLSESLFELELKGLDTPDIPNILHWFRRYVIVDLTLIRAIIRRETDESDRGFFELCFASIVRNSSNADPVPVSGLEVTSHMLKRDAAGRIVDPYLLFSKSVARALSARELLRDLPTYDRGVAASATFVRLDSTRELDQLGVYDTVITSPPYHGAVDYYRRHTLEMYWLDLVASARDRLAIRPAYIGRLGVAVRDCEVEPLSSRYGEDLAERMTAGAKSVSKDRGLSLRHYSLGMQRFFQSLSRVLPGRDAAAVLVVGDSHWNGERIDTARLLSELAEPYFVLVDIRDHSLKNRYMSYSRHNAASIDMEHVLVFRRQ
jgi:hypothetical protein